jgi:hypothetical protein
MKQKRRQLNAFQVHVQTGQKVRISAAAIYGDIQDAVGDMFTDLSQEDSLGNYSQRLHQMSSEQKYRQVLAFVAATWGLNRKDLEQAYANLRTIYDKAVVAYTNDALMQEKIRQAETHSELQNMKFKYPVTNTDKGNQPKGRLIRTESPED